MKKIQQLLKPNWRVEIYNFEFVVYNHETFEEKGFDTEEEVIAYLESL